VTISKELSKYKFDLVQEVRWDGGGTEPTGEYTMIWVLIRLRNFNIV
jgi:hypothetical protein